MTHSFPSVFKEIQITISFDLIPSYIFGSETNSVQNKNFKNCNQFTLQEMRNILMNEIDCDAISLSAKQLVIVCTAQ